jgi:murein L,D-transpeptidase YafK
VRALALSAAIASAVALVGSGAYGLPSGPKHLRPLPDALVSEMQKKEMTAEAPILVRIFKQEAELEVWKQDRSGKFSLLKVYPICRWSGELGPKIRQGDRQAPEGFYTITSGQLNPNSSYYLSFNIGYPNAFDRAHERTGSALMIHGDCLSAGCYAMTDEQMGELYALAREALAAGQPGFQVQALPFRMNPLNMARHRNNPHMPFWKSLKQGYDYFEATRQQPKVDVCEKRYVFNARGNSTGAAEACPASSMPEVVASKARRDEAATIALINQGTPAAPIRTGEDGGMHPVFVASLKRPSSFWDPAGLFSPRVAAAPGTVPPHVNPPKNASPVYAPTMAYAPERTANDVVASIPVPRAAPRKEGGLLQVATFSERFGPFLSADEATGSSRDGPSGFRLASAETRPADADPVAAKLLRAGRQRVASADGAMPSPDSPAAEPEVTVQRGRVASALSRVLAVGREANAAETPAAEPAPKQTTPSVAREEQPSARPETAALFANTSMQDLKVLTAQPMAVSVNFESRWSAFR